MTEYAVRSREELGDKAAEFLADPPSPFGFWSDVILPKLTLDQVAPFLRPEALARYRSGEETWEVTELDADRLRDEAIGYLDFAYGKALNHRGISAWRSVEKMAAHCWILGAPWDLVAGPDHAQYGAPGLKAAAEFLGHPFPTDGPLARMAEGLPCEPDCIEGCGR